MFWITLAMNLFEGLIKNFPWEAGPQQVEGFQELTRFLAEAGSRERLAFILKGYAGTGKTTMISTLVKTLPRFGTRTVLLAPTGRAAKVMSQYSRKKAMTIHKKIFRKKSAINLDATFELSHNSHQDTLFIVDEASMISHERLSFRSQSLLEDLISYIKKGQNCRLLLVGDSAQLPPVGVMESPALDLEQISFLTGSPSQLYELTEVMRQEIDSGILVNATKIRQLIRQDDPKSNTSFPKFKIKGFTDIFRMTGERLIEGLHYAYEKFGMEETIVICRSNKHANLYNKHIRNQILFRDEEISGGDHIMVVKNNYHWLQKTESGQETFIANGDMGEIIRVRNIHEQHGYRFADVLLRFLDSEDGDEPIECRVMLDTLYTEHPNLPYEDQKVLYERILNEYSDLGTKRKQMEALKVDPYYNALQIKFAMAVTCHKAQGGQWKAVFVDQGYFTEEQLHSEFLRWLYTACTRATAQLFLVNFNAQFFDEKPEG